MTGIILSGGENRRMGSDKAFLVIGGRPIIEHILSVFKGLFERVIIVTNSPERYTSYDVAVFSDALDVRGPLTGIYTGLLNSRDEYNFVAACDMPFLNAELISYMKESAEGYDAVVPNVRGLVEPLHAVYHKRLLPNIERHLGGNRLEIRGIFRGANVRYLSEEEIDRFDPERRSFININSPTEYKEAICSDSECRSS